jgi:hypothetical protein
MSIEGKCRFGKLQLLIQLNRLYLSKKPLFSRRKEDEKFKEKNPFRQVPINAPSHWPLLLTGNNSGYFMYNILSEIMGFFNNPSDPFNFLRVF